MHRKESEEHLKDIIFHESLDKDLFMEEIKKFKENLYKYVLIFLDLQSKERITNANKISPLTYLKGNLATSLHSYLDLVLHKYNDDNPHIKEIITAIVAADLEHAIFVKSMSIIPSSFYEFIHLHEKPDGRLGVILSEGISIIKNYYPISLSHIRINLLPTITKLAEIDDSFSMDCIYHYKYRFRKLVYGSDKVLNLSDRAFNPKYIHIFKHDKLDSFIDSIDFTKLNLSNNFIGEISQTYYGSGSWRAQFVGHLLKMITKPSLTSLDLSFNDFQEMDLLDFQKICDALRRSNVKELNMDDMAALPETHLSMLYDAIRGSKINFIVCNYFKFMYFNKTEPFWDLIKNKIFYLNLKGYLSYDGIKHIIKKTNDSCVRQLELQCEIESNILSSTLEEREKKFFDDISSLLKNNIHLSNLLIYPYRLIENPSLVRNRLFLKMQETISDEKIDGLTIYNEFLKEMPELIEDWPQDKLGLLYNVEATLIEKATAYFIKENDPANAVTCWLSISSNNPAYQRMHFAAFEYAYVKYRDELPSQEAILCALPCLLNDKDEFIALETDQQQIFDGFLAEAAGLEETLTIGILQPDVRLSLLKYLIISTLSANLIKKLDSSSYMFFSERELVLRCDLLSLPLSLDDLDDINMQKNINKVWNNIIDKKINIKEDEYNLDKIIHAISVIDKAPRRRLLCVNL